VSFIVTLKFGCIGFVFNAEIWEYKAECGMGSPALEHALTPSGLDLAPPELTIDIHCRSIVVSRAQVMGKATQRTVEKLLR
jgi:hypothetical protein